MLGTNRHFHARSISVIDFAILIRLSVVFCDSEAFPSFLTDDHAGLFSFHSYDTNKNGKHRNFQLIAHILYHLLA